MAGKARPRPKRKPLGRRQHRRIERAVQKAERVTGLQFCVYLGSTQPDSRVHAEGLFERAGLLTRPAVLLLVAPEQHRVEVVTAPAVRPRISDGACAHAITKMTARFTKGDVAGGIVTGLRHLVAVAGAGRAAPGSEELPDLLHGDSD